MTRRLLLLAALLLSTPAVAADFVRSQRKRVRVKKAFKNRDAALRALFASKEVAYPPRRIFVRIFKKEGEVELWAGPRTTKLKRVKTYPVCSASGVLGPKRQQGDEQVPEGFYRIDRFNPVSSFHLSLGLDYPNRSDRILGGRGDLGGDIFIHGACVSIGCVAITDPLIEELYVVAVHARGAGQRNIPVHIFPLRMDDEGMQTLKREAGDSVERLGFWANLREGYTYFETHRRVPRVRVDAKGRYRFR